MLHVFAVSAPKFRSLKCILVVAGGRYTISCGLSPFRVAVPATAKRDQGAARRCRVSRTACRARVRGALAGKPPVAPGGRPGAMLSRCWESMLLGARRPGGMPSPARCSCRQSNVSRCFRKRKHRTRAGKPGHTPVISSKRSEPRNLALVVAVQPLPRRDPSTSLGVTARKALPRNLAPRFAPGGFHGLALVPSARRRRHASWG